MRNAKKVRAARTPQLAPKRHGKLNGKKVRTKAGSVATPGQLAWADHCEARAQGKLAMSDLRAQRGLLSHIARELGVKPQAVHQWTMVPLERVLEVERITGIPREKLRPDFHLTRAR